MCFSEHAICTLSLPPASLRTRLCVLQIAFLTRRVMLPPPAPPPWAVARFLAGQTAATQRRAAAAQAMAEANAWAEEWAAAAEPLPDARATEPLTPRADDESGGNDNAAAAALAAAGAVAEAKALAAQREEAEFAARTVPLVAVALDLAGRSLAVPQVRVLATGLGRAAALSSLDLRHNPFERDEEAYDEVRRECRERRDK
jgi:hypothetical protein